MTMGTYKRGRRPGAVAWRVLGMGALLAFSGVLGAAPAAAQQPRQRPDLERQLRQRFEAMVQRELGLDDETSAALREVSRSFQEPRRELAVRQRRLNQRMRSTGAILSEEAAQEVLQELLAVKQEEVLLLESEQDQLLQILTPPQVVRFYTLREELAQRVQRLRRDRGVRNDDGGALLPRLRDGPGVPGPARFR